MSRWLGSAALLVAIYLLSLGSTNPWDAGFGLVAAAVVLVGFRRFLGVGHGPVNGSFVRRALAFPRFIAAIAIEVVKGTWQVARITLGFEPLRSPGIVEVPIGDRTETGVAVSAIATTLPPGGFLVDVDRNRGVMLVHVLDASDPEAVIREHQEFYVEYQRAVFP